MKGQVVRWVGGKIGRNVKLRSSKGGIRVSIKRTTPEPQSHTVMSEFSLPELSMAGGVSD